MVRVVPSPVLCAFVVVVKHPLEPFDVLLKHLALEGTTFLGVYIDM